MLYHQALSAAAFLSLLKVMRLRRPYCGVCTQIACVKVYSTPNL
jgi:hypothetical protein